MTFEAAVRSCLSKCTTFTGRAPRSEFWWFCLFLWLAEAALLIVVGLLVAGLLLLLRDNQRLFTVILTNGFNLLSIFINVSFLALFLAVSVRRLHDIGRSGWWVLLAIAPLGILVVIYWWAQPSAPKANSYGAPPLPAAG
ncbi:DUF805 domain-containing protein [Xanthobacter flavus]|uniref:DUF805 domain-containing protein n=1 Tax=Xanthobacter flavus TaxID=281 RepID=UPI003728DD38